MIRTYVDSSAYLAAVRSGNKDLQQRARLELTRPGVEYVTSVFVELEILPLPSFHKFTTQVEELRHQLSFSRTARVSVARAVAETRTISYRDGISGMDAIHLAIAELEGCDFILCRDADYNRSSVVKPLQLLGE